VTLVRPPVHIALLVTAATMLGATPLWPQTTAPSEEYRLKAAFVYRFPQFVEWPAPALEGHESVAICVLRPNPFGAVLRELIAGETLNGRRLAIREIDGPSAIAGCHVVFVPGTGTPAGKAVLKAVAHRPVLTVGESPRFLDEGGVISLQVIDRRVRFEVSATAAERVGLRLSSQLLRLAVRVRGAA
jgi:uncharacterized protein DUF4154